MLESLYGGPVEITGIGICGGIRPSQRKQWYKQHQAHELHSSHHEDDNHALFQPVSLGRLQVSHRSSRSSVAFPEPLEASFNPNFYKYYESDSSGEPNSNRFRFNPGRSHNSSFSPQPRQHKRSVDTLPNLTPQKAKRPAFEPLFNPDSTDEKWAAEAHARPQFQSPTADINPQLLSSSESNLPPIRSPNSPDL